MLIDVTIENYRSIKGPVTLSFVEAARGPGASRQGKGKRPIRPDVEIAPAAPVDGRGFAVLPVAGVFGANASGKTNLVRAIAEFLEVIARGAGAERDPLEFVVPIQAGSANRGEPLTVSVQDRS